jgi:methyl-accepting chemotaxis protein
MLHARLWPAILAAICLIGLHSFRLFLLFIGPLKRLRWAFESMKTGDLTIQVVLRDGDFLIEEGDSLNETIGVLAKQVKKAKAAAGTARDALASLGADIQKLPPDYSSRLTENLQVVQSSLAEERRCLNYFRTPGKKTPREETVD